VTAVDVDEGERNAPVVVLEEMVPEPKDGDGEAMGAGAVYDPDPVHGEAAISAGTHTIADLLLASYSPTKSMELDYGCSLLRKLGCVIKCRGNCAALNDSAAAIAGYSLVGSVAVRRSHF
jgi:hypothetical protein